jgi:hypothetical protein
VLGFHVLEWAFLALASSSDSAPSRTCPCPQDYTAWTALFWTPEALIAVGLLAGLIARKLWVSLVSLVVAFPVTVVLFFVYLHDIRRVWSLPRFPPF